MATEMKKERMAEYEPIWTRFMTMELPTLNGSEKQVKWAEEVRSEYVQKLRAQHKDDMKSYRSTSSSGPSTYTIEHMQRMIDEVLSCPASSYWIRKG